MQQGLSIGLMSGTSMDGIDCALIDTDGTPTHLQTLGYVTVAYPPDFRLLLKATEYAIRLYEGDVALASEHFTEALAQYGEIELKLPASQFEHLLKNLSDALGDSLCRTQTISLEAVIQRSTDFHIKAVKQLITKLGLMPSDVKVIGYHGQCFYHQPSQQRSVILGDGQRMADALQIQVIQDFRREDILAGGQGAPFAPIYHQALACRDKQVPLAVVNCGGIANVSFVLGEDEKDLFAFDTGPGNALMDQLMRQRTHGRLHFDNHGETAKLGKIKPKLMQALWRGAVKKGEQAYLDLPPPKSLDYGDLKLIPAIEAASLSDACRTLAAFTAETIVDSIKWLAQAPPLRWVLSGGGWENPVLLAEFKERLLKVLPAADIKTADDMGWQSQALEAQIFAYLAVRRLKALPLSFPSTTGVPKAITGGTILFPVCF